MHTVMLLQKVAFSSDLGQIKKKKKVDVEIPMSHVYYIFNKQCINTNDVTAVESIIGAEPPSAVHGWLALTTSCCPQWWSACCTVEVWWLLTSKCHTYTHTHIVIKSSPLQGGGGRGPSAAFSGRDERS